MRELQPFGRKLTTWTSVGVVALLILYPVLVYLGFTYLRGPWVAALVIAICLLRLFLAGYGRSGPLAGPQILIVCGVGIALAAASIMLNAPDAMLYYPVLVSLGLLLLFGHSLVYPPTIIERIARFADPDLPFEAIAYTRRVTIAWCVFFVCNGSIALYTALRTSLETWAFYNGIVAYILIGLMFGGEFLLRMRVMRKVRQ